MTCFFFFYRYSSFREMKKKNIGRYLFIFWIYLNFFFFFYSCIFLLFYPMRSMGESIGIGLAASSTSKDPQAKTTEPIVSIKVTDCSIQLGWILARDGFAKNYIGSRPEGKKCHFFHLVRADVCMDGWMDGCYRFFRPRFFPHRWTDWNEIDNLPLV